MKLKNRVQLITYPDSLGGNLARLHALLAGPLAGLFGGVHLLPFYPSSGDRGFAPIDYREVEPRFGSWADVRRIGAGLDVVADLMVNHLSRRSAAFQDFQRRGRRSEYADLFLTLDKVWPGGQPADDDLRRIFLRRPGLPFAEVRIENTGERERVWATFGSRDWSEQIDLDVSSAAMRAMLAELLGFLAGQRIRIVRLDAVGYVIKKPGTSCFFVEPDIYHFLGWIRDVAQAHGVEILPDIHAPFSVQARLAAHGFPVYDFVLPLLILHSLFTGSSRKLRAHLRACPRRQFTMLDCHDGIPVQPDLDGVLEVDESRAVVERLLERGANVSPLLVAGGGTPAGFDAHQVNCTYYSALGSDDDAYLAARAIQFFAPGIPQVYYVGLLAGENDPAARSAGERRAINRHDYEPAEIEQALDRPVVRRLLRLIRLRNEHPAFGGDFQVLEGADRELGLVWRHQEAHCALHVDLETAEAVIRYSDPAGRLARYQL